MDAGRRKVKPSKSSLSSQSSKLSKVNNFFKKAGSEWNLLIARVKSLGEEVFTEDQVISEIFVESDTDYILEKLDKLSKGYSVNEERFLSQYQKFKSLDKMYENCQHNQAGNGSAGGSANGNGNGNGNNSEDIKSSSTVFSDTHNRVSLKDVIRQTNSSSSTPGLNEEGKSCGIDTDVLEDIADVEDDDELDEDASNDVTDKEATFTYHELDVVRLKEQFDSDSQRNSNTGSGDNEVPEPETNIGQILWEYRRSLWLKSPKGATVTGGSLFFDQVPQESYVKIYNNLVEKGRALKPDRRINLHDLIRVINAGWESEEKWDRAAKGLP